LRQEGEWGERIKRKSMIYMKRKRKQHGRGNELSKNEKVRVLKGERKHGEKQI